MKCRVCRVPAVIDVRRHNAGFCANCFVKHCRDQLARAVESYDMFGPEDRILVAVSGGKDSLALWDMLLSLGYRADGLYLGLGIGTYSDESGSYARDFARSRDAELIEIDLPGRFGYDIPAGSAAARRAPCSACGLSKRHLFNQAALDGGYDVVATGHNLDDEAAVLLGNTLRWDLAYLGRQHPVLPAGNGFVRKVKPLVRLGEREMAAYCVIQDIDYIVEECPMAEGNRHLGYKNALNEIEDRSPGSKAAFLFGFLDRMAPLVQATAEAEREALHPCPGCGSPTVSEVCAFCKLVERAGGHLDDRTGHEVPVAAPTTRSSGRDGGRL
ncbi:MAG: tRNA(Ile)-lysidine synthetase [Actinomycetota bacterium]|nr:tRNA(Ile)-lysidine synthetase [Actinomycetota bacterium]